MNSTFPTRRYFDHNATSPCPPEVRKALLEGLEKAWGNASSLHLEGRAAAEALVEAREELASLTRTRPAEWVLCSGATEAADLAWRGLALGLPDRDLVVAPPALHPCLDVPLTSRFTDQSVLVRPPLDRSGRFDPEALAQACGPRTRAVVVLWAHNETGVVSDIAALGALLRARGVLLLVDAVQAFGRIEVDLPSSGADIAILSGHKFGAPQGIGALWIRRGAPWRAPHRAGGQERGRRGGTPAAPLACALSAAIRVARARMQLWPVQQAARDAYEERLLSLVPGARVLGRDAPRLPNTSLVALAGADAGSVLGRLDSAGWALSSGSACAAGHDGPSPILRALGLPHQESWSTLRASSATSTDPSDWLELAEVIAHEVASIRARGHRAFDG